jgi:DNA repair protein SbcD/Mre11
MKLLYLTDTHIRGTSPRSRTDDYQQTLKEKLREVQQIIQRERVDYVLHGGDVFDRPNLAPAVVRDFVQILQQFAVPIYAVAGNHDIYGHNPATIDRTMLGLLDTMGVIQLLQAGQKVRLEKAGRSVQLSGQAFHFDLDRRDLALDYGVTNELNADYTIHMVHSMLVDRALPEGVAFTLLGQLEQLSAEVTPNLLLTGHYHTGFPLQKRAGKYVLNPGALARVNNHPAEIGRTPQVVLIKLADTMQIRLIPLASAAAGEEVLDRSYLEEAAHRQSKLASFVQEIQAASTFRALDVMEIIEEIAQLEAIDATVKQEALRRIAVVQEAAEEREA